MSKQIAFEVEKRLKSGDLGEKLDDGFYMADLGRGETPSSAPAVEAEKAPGRAPKTRAERAEIAGQMAANLMDYFMKPETLNDSTILNPIRDGIPQCTKHPFVSGDPNKIGCIKGCGPNERDSAGNLPVAREGTLGDAWQWVRAVVEDAAMRQDKRLFGGGGLYLGGN